MLKLAALALLAAISPPERSQPRNEAAWCADASEAAPPIAHNTAAWRSMPRPSVDRPSDESILLAPNRHCIRIYPHSGCSSATGDRVFSGKAQPDGWYGEATIQRVEQLLGYTLTADDPESTKPPATPETKPAPASPPPVPSLDDLLGTKPDKPASKPETPAADKPADGAPADTDPDRANLDRLLTGAELGDAFSEAITLMGDAAKRLEDSRDTSITTQRVQEDVVRRLDQLLASLQRQQSSSSSSSSSSQSQQDQQQGKKNQPNQKKPGSKQGQQNQNGDGSKDWDGPPKQEGALKPALDSARAAWGSLPARIRDMLLQGSEDPFSATYKTMTEAYYRKLAEEKK